MTHSQHEQSDPPQQVDELLNTLDARYAGRERRDSSAYFLPFERYYIKQLTVDLSHFNTLKKG